MGFFFVMASRITVKREYPEKLFYERVLNDWKASIDDRNRQFVVAKALQGLKKHPIDVKGYTDLRRINGIGENIATRLDAAWKGFVAQFPPEGPRVRDVKEVKKGDFMPYLTNAFVAKGKQRVPFLSRNDADEPQPGPSKAKPPKGKRAAPAVRANGEDDEELMNVSMSQPVALPSYIADRPLQGLRPPPATTNTCEGSVTFLTYEPASYDACEIVLIVDGRETGNGRSKNKKSICDHLDKLCVKYDTRPLSVGDYLWLIRLPDGQELTLDYVVERKTWDDLKASIRQSRYHEQKLRLKKSGLRNIILVAEGGEATDRSLEQALASTSVDNQFFIQRTANIQGTAKFLAAATQRLRERALTDTFIGLSFESLQAESRKTKSQCVSDLFLRQLTVCPMMSVEKACIVAERFPTFRSLAEFFRRNNALPVGVRKDPELLLHEAVPQIGKALSRQVSLFFH